MLDGLTNRPNTIVQRQKIYQADTRPVYQRGPRSRVYMTAFMALFTLGLAGTAHGFYNAAWGIKKQEE